MWKIESKQLDIEGLNITVTSSGKPGAKPKGKPRSEGLEILANATLKLKAGTHYAMIGRNGTGKSSECMGPSVFSYFVLLMFYPAILKAVAEKLIPGIPLPTRISILQQTSAEDQPASSMAVESSQAESSGMSSGQLSVLAEVINKATSRNEIQQEIDGGSTIFL
jgi:hypothetical protein